VLAASPRCASEALRIIAALTLTPSSASPASQRHQHPAQSRPSAPSPRAFITAISRTFQQQQPLSTARYSDEVLSPAAARTSRCAI
jgi:hypothetical protein